MLFSLYSYEHFVNAMRKIWATLNSAVRNSNNNNKSEFNGCTVGKRRMKIHFHFSQNMNLHARQLNFLPSRNGQNTFSTCNTKYFMNQFCSRDYESILREGWRMFLPLVILWDYKCIELGWRIHPLLTEKIWNLDFSLFWNPRLSFLEVSHFQFSTFSLSLHTWHY